jgi:poly [ADP-ribose] polymerase
MAHKLEVSPSGRARCRGCKEAIAKGDLRFCEEYTSAFTDGEAYRYWHVLCAAPKLPVQVKQAMDAYDGDIPNKAEIETAMTAGAKKGGKGGAKLPFPHADVAPTGRARCMGCDETLEKGKLRVAVERETETPTGMMVRGAGYLHPKCSLGWAEEQGLEPEEFIESVFANSMLEDAQRDELTEAFEG